VQRGEDDAPDVSTEIYTLDPFLLMATFAGIRTSTAWSPDGARFLAVLDRCEETERLVSIELATGALTELARDMVMAYAFSPDGRWVAFTAFGRDAFVVPADGSGAPRFISDDAATPSTPVWSADSRYAAFSSHDGGYDRCFS
jgi:Tol biopolymer transport system component